MRMNATGASLGSHVRVGLEDSLWDGPGNLAKTNADQVKSCLLYTSDAADE